MPNTMIIAGVEFALCPVCSEPIFHRDDCSRLAELRGTTLLPQSPPRSWKLANGSTIFFTGDPQEEKLRGHPSAPTPSLRTPSRNQSTRPTHGGYPQTPPQDATGRS